MKIVDFTTTRKFAAIVLLASFVFSNVFAVNAVRYGASASSATTRFTADLTQLGREGRLREDLQFAAEVNTLVAKLADGGLQQQVIVADSPEVQNKIVEQLAIRIARGRVPASLEGRSIIKVDTANLFSNSRSAAEAEANI